MIHYQLHLNNSELNHNYIYENRKQIKIIYGNNFQLYYYFQYISNSKFQLLNQKYFLLIFDKYHVLFYSYFHLLQFHSSLHFHFHFHFYQNILISFERNLITYKRYYPSKINRALIL